MREKKRCPVLQERDFEILLGLFECRVMMLRHIRDLHFDGKEEATKKRMQALKSEGYVGERPRRIGDPCILQLKKKGFLVLRDSGKLSRYPHITQAEMVKRAEVSDATLKHELEVMNIRLAFFKAIRERSDLSIVEFSTWPKLNKFVAWYTSPTYGRRQRPQSPDGFIRIRQTNAEGTYEHTYFLEIDQSTESQEVIAQKAACYLEYYQSGGMALRFGGTRENFRDYPFRVLMVFKNDERRNNAAERLLLNTPPILTQVWLSTIEEAAATPLQSVWIRPKDYLDVTKETRFDPSRRSPEVPYRRQMEREKSLELIIIKHTLLRNET